MTLTLVASNGRPIPPVDAMSELAVLVELLNANDVRCEIVAEMEPRARRCLKSRVFQINAALTPAELREIRLWTARTLLAGQWKKAGDV